MFTSVAGTYPTKRSCRKGATLKFPRSPSLTALSRIAKVNCLYALPDTSRRARWMKKSKFA